MSNTIYVILILFTPVLIYIASISGTSKEYLQKFDNVNLFLYTKFGLFLGTTASAAIGASLIYLSKVFIPIDISRTNTSSIQNIFQKNIYDYIMVYTLPLALLMFGIGLPLADHYNIKNVGFTIYLILFIYFLLYTIYISVRFSAWIGFLVFLFNITLFSVVTWFA